MRDLAASKAYWDKWVEFSARNIAKDLAQISTPSGNPIYRPQFVWDTSMEHLRLIFRRYSRGDDVHELQELLVGLIDTWELSNTLAREVCTRHNLETCRDWVFELSNLNHYVWCFWVVGLALLLSISDEDWERLLKLVGSEGEDLLIDKVIATRQKDRNISAVLLHEKPYARLSEAINAPESQKSTLLLCFVKNWYGELNRKGKQQPWWYVFGDPDKSPIELGSYFGRWCIEAAVCAKAFNIDDGGCLGHEYYPGDFLRPNGPSIHAPPLKIKKKWFGFF